MKHIKSNRTRIRRLFLSAIAMFFLVFLLRWGYELVFTNNDIVVTAPSFGISLDSYSYSRRFTNIATDKISQIDITGNTIIIDQKYEKTANISSISHRFDEDNEVLRQLIDTYDAVVQTENLQGLPGNQVLTVTIGVAPAQFDYMVNGLRELGNLQSFTVNQVDRTNEFNMLLAQQEVLRKARESYAALHEMGGSIQDMLLLQERILVVETELQHLGVDLGIFATGHSFCTINFTLREQAPPLISIQFVLNSAFISFWWTLAAAVIVSSIILGLLTAVAVGLWLRIQIGRQMQTPVSNDVNNLSETETASPTDTDA